MKDHRELVDSLAADLQPVGSAVPDLGVRTGLWLALSALYVVAVTGLMGPIRSTALEQLLSQPRFLLECLLGVAAITVLGVALFRAAVPGRLSPRLRLGAGLLLAIWLGNYVLGLVSPALEPSMEGKRGYCVYETLLYALPPLLLALYWLRGLYPLNPTAVALVAGLAAGMLPALYMQIACMYEPLHILSFHILPGLAVALLGPPLWRLLQRWWPGSQGV